ncbi:hypothetical protein ENUP19_0347G0036 [Entamoeba nuttalli]|nr:iron-sulfur cluster-binding protein, putative [Entamoeba nuttalli P19]EKE37659.1 iron-sulfur cluster-binding protein, putative [Entamoeba nuttalli P19]|eukprot:XP_008860011.1 iron-sulfur cluster-binding protein, putative [Entamoeba nuttalli P19]
MGIFVSEGKRIIVTNDCIGCSACMDNCPAGVLEIVNGICTAPRIDECLQCHLCEDNCPINAIKVE